VKLQVEVSVNTHTHAELCKYLVHINSSQELLNAIRQCSEQSFPSVICIHDSLIYTTGKKLGVSEIFLFFFYISFEEFPQKQINKY